MSDKNDIVFINLDRPRMLWFGHKALKTLGAIMGKTLNELVESLNEVGFEEIEKVMYCGLLTDAKNNGEILKIEEIEDLLDLAPYKEIISAMNKAIESSLGGDETEQKNQQRIAETKKK